MSKPSPADSARLRRLRRAYKNLGYRIWKVREDGRWYGEYGPYSLIHVSDNRIVIWSMTLDDLEAELKEMAQ